MLKWRAKFIAMALRLCQTLAEVSTICAKAPDLEVLFVYEVNTAQLLGFLLFRVVADQAEIFTLVIAQNARKQGVGMALLQKFLARVQSRVETIFLEVAAE